MIDLQLDSRIRSILGALDENGFKAYITGGVIRDIMLNRSPHDVDILTSASLIQIKQLFGSTRVKTVGKTFPVCLVDGIEVSSGRGGAGLDHFPESDLAQRDFTFNAMAYDPFMQKISDPFNGRQDLADKIIRFVQDPEKRIVEDPVRMVRACRFCAMISGTFSLSALKAINGNKELLKNVAKERIRDEVIKAMALEKPSVFFEALKKNNLLDKIFPSLDRCYDQDGGPHHNETVFEHCMLVGDALTPKHPVLRLAGFLHDTGKFDAAVIKDGRLSFPGHETHVTALVNDIETLRFSSKDVVYIKSIVQAHMRPLTHETTPKAVRRLLAMLDQKHLDYTDFMRMRIADKKGNLRKSAYTLSELKIRLGKLFMEMNKKTCTRMTHLALSGNDIMKICDIPPGPEVGQIRALLFEKVLDNPQLNTDTALEQLCRSLKAKK